MVANLTLRFKEKGRLILGDRLMKRYGKGLDKHLFKTMKVALDRSGDEFVNEMVSTAPVRTGQLRRSVRHKVKGGKMDTLALTVSSRGHPGALVQEHGAVIRARNSKYLTIPGPAVKTAAGVARTSFKSWMSQNQGAIGPSQQGKKRRGGFVMLPTKKGKGWVVVGKTPTGKLKKLHAWVLKEQVTIPGPETTGTKSNFGFMDSWDKFGEARSKRQLRAVVEAIKAAGKSEGTS